ncbi:MAG: hypothetical protein AVDCRST_MAG89-4261, partial [uncultured Gemmatimonadetes bacterium]
EETDLAARSRSAGLRHLGHHRRRRRSARLSAAGARRGPRPGRRIHRPRRRHRLPARRAPRGAVQGARCHRSGAGARASLRPLAARLRGPQAGPQLLPRPDGGDVRGRRADGLGQAGFAAGFAL